jgi:diguanylate cyclase (GGDEF)-like protein/PAS domain S-box-containing protein
VVDIPDNSAVPMVVLARQQEHVEFINSTLRKVGHAVHCHWVNELNDLSETLTQINTQMILAIVGKDATDATTILQAIRQLAPDIPTLLVREHIDEAIINQAMQLGARDVVSMGNPQRLQAVVSRELRSFRLEHKLATTLNATQEYREQLKQLMSGSADAILQVQEGIAINPNPAWLKLLGYADAVAIEGNPVMDFFESDSHSALKGALAACLQGKWSGHALRINALLADGNPLPLELLLQPVELDSEPAIQLKVSARKYDDRPIVAQLDAALERDATSGLLQWRFFVEQLRQKLTQSIKGGIRALVCIQPDKFTALLDQLGPAQLEEFIAHFIAPIKEQLQPHDLAGRFGNSMFFVLLERGTHGDVEAWCSNVTRRIAAQAFNAGDKSLSCTGTVGIAMAAPHTSDIDSLINDAIHGKQQVQQEGGNRTEVVNQPDDDTQQQVNDKLWVRLIKAALMENRFRLLQQPIVTLSGEDKGMSDVLVRMLDELNQEVLPSEFLAAAERNDLMKNIDRWVIGAAISFCGTRKINKMFVRLSKDSMMDRSLPTWLANQLRATRIAPGQIVFEIAEAVVSNYLNNTIELATQLHKIGFRFALEHAGHARDSVQLLSHLPLDYVKIDGALMQGLATDVRTQETISALIAAAKKQGIITIAERVEDANTMAVLWQLGMEYVQGYFVHEPERVTLG